jgi:hypothetical protein
MYGGGVLFWSSFGGEVLFITSLSRKAFLFLCGKLR